ncbi:MAG: hypothetical protein WC030_00905 [Candidatus Paceibacterota bacterium]
MSVRNWERASKKYRALRAAGATLPAAKAENNPEETVCTLADFLAGRAGTMARRLLAASGEKLLLAGYEHSIGEAAILLTGVGLVHEMISRGSTPTHLPVGIEMAEGFFRNLESQRPEAKEWFLGKGGVAGLVPAIRAELDSIARRVD